MARRDVLKSMIAGIAVTPLAAGNALALLEPEPPATSQIRSRRNQLFDSGWRFHRGDAEGAESAGFDDSAWRRVELPHDWSIEDLPATPQEDGQGALWGGINMPLHIGPFDRYQSEGGGSTAWSVGGVGWYRKRFAAEEVGADGQVEILFEGIYMNSDVWLNGQHMGNHPYGYTSFAYDLSPYLKRQGENVIAVRVRNEGRNSRWYSGSGIYRHVWLNVTGPVRVPLWGVYVSTPEVSAASATVKVAVKIENHTQASRRVTAYVTLLDMSRRVVGKGKASRQVDAGGNAEVEQTITVASPRPWSPDEPNLYSAGVDLVEDGKTVDSVSMAFGIRKIEADAQNGLRINGKVVKLRGGCMHHANGLLGSAAIDRAEERRVELMKLHGFNAIRCAHNPPSPKFLETCDRLGMMVLDEAFDMWSVGKNPQDYHLYFKDWWKRDLDSMVLRDRNHPSVIFWSIGNEIPNRATPEGVAEAKELVDEVKRLDDSRLVTAALNFLFVPGKPPGWANNDPAFQYLDVCGFNYEYTEYEKDHERLPKRIMLGTESLPRSAFDNWQAVEKFPYVLGDFVWTGMDYLGEAGIGNTQLKPANPRFRAPARKGELSGVPLADFGLSWSEEFPWFVSNCGDISLTGDDKPQFYYRRVVWGMSKLEMAVQRPVPKGSKQEYSAWGWPDELQSWTWPGHEGKSLTVRVFSSGDQVRLLLNGKEIATKPVSAETKLIAEFEVPYAAGELKAVALKDGKTIAETAFKTAGKPAGLRIAADRRTIRTDRNDLAYVTLEITDRAGNLVPDAAVPVSFEISGAAELAAVGTANPKDMRSFRGRNPSTFHGRCTAIVRPAGKPGSVTLVAKSPGLPPARIVLRVGWDE